MKKIFKKLQAFGMVCIMLVSLMPVNVAKAAAASAAELLATELNKCVAESAVVSGNWVTLQKDVELASSGYTLSTGDVILNLNGKTLSGKNAAGVKGSWADTMGYDALKVAGANLTICDLKGTGKLKGGDGYPNGANVATAPPAGVALIVKSGSVTIDGVDVYGGNGVMNNWSSVDLGAGNGADAVQIEGGTLKITSGTFTGGERGQGKANKVLIYGNEGKAIKITAAGVGYGSLLANDNAQYKLSGTVVAATDTRLASAKKIDVTLKSSSECTLTFNDAIAGNSTTKCLAGGTVQVKADPASRDGYAFAGWSLAEGGTTVDYKANDTILLNTDMTIYAVWVPASYKLIFMPNGTSGAMQDQEFKYGTPQKLSKCTYSRYGYVFAGWSTDINATTPEYLDEQEVSNLISVDNGTLTLYAVWKIPSYMVSFDGNGADGDMEDQVFEAGVEQELSANAYTRTGYIFKGWASSSSGAVIYGDGAPITVTANKTLYAVWEPEEYTVSFDGNGATSGSMEAQSFTYDEEASLSANTFEKTGYEFKGWATASNGEVAYTDNQAVTNLSVSTLYAVWEPEEYTVSFDGNGATSGSMEAQSFTYDVEASLSANTFEKTGYEFKGWATASDGEVAYTDNQAVTNVSVSTLYAVWEPEKYTVSFDGNGATSGSMEAQSFTYDEEASLSANTFEKTGYEFKGWATTADGEVAYTDKQAVTNLSVSTLYAVWEKIKEDTPAKDFTKVKVSGITSKKYTGAKIKQTSLRVLDGDKVLVAGTDYTVSYSNNVNIGTAKITLTGKGDYTGRVIKSFAIKVAKGDTYTVSNLKYKIVDPAKSVMIIGATNKTSKSFKTLNIAGAVTIGGKSFNVVTIGSSAFKGAKYLQTVTIGKNVTKISASAFYGCGKLANIVVKSTKITAIGKNAIKGIKAAAIIDVPNSKITAYKKLFTSKTGYIKSMKIK